MWGLPELNALNDTAVDNLRRKRADTEERRQFAADFAKKLEAEEKEPPHGCLARYANTGKGTGWPANLEVHGTVTGRIPSQPNIQDPSGSISRLEKAERLVLEAVDVLTHLTREANGLVGFREQGLRHLFGNTNTDALKTRLEAAQLFLARSEVQRYIAGPKPLEGAAYTEFLQSTAEVVKDWPSWKTGEPEVVVADLADVYEAKVAEVILGVEAGRTRLSSSNLIIEDGAGD